MLINEYLEQKNITQRKFAEQVGCTTAFINSIINGKNTDIKISLLRKICKKTGIDESKLITELLKAKSESRL